MKKREKKEFVVIQITPIVDVEHLEKNEIPNENKIIRYGATLAGLYLITLSYLLIMKYQIGNNPSLTKSTADIKNAITFIDTLSILYGGVGTVGIVSMFVGFAKKYPVFADILKKISGYNYIKRKFDSSDSVKEMEDTDVKRR